MQNQITGLSSSGDYVNGAALTHLRLVCNLRVFLDFQFNVQGTDSSCGQENLEIHLVYQLDQFLDQETFLYIHSCLSYFACGPLDPKCSTGNSFKQLSQCSCNISFLQAALVTNRAWVQFKVLAITYKVLHSIGGSYLRDQQSALPFVHLIQLDQEVTLGPINRTLSSSRTLEV